MLPPAGAVPTPPVGVASMPAVAVAVQVTDAFRLPSVLSTITLTSADSPPDRFSAVGSVRRDARVLGGNVTGPGANDGVPSPAPVPQLWSGWPASVKLRTVAPDVGNISHVCVVALPLTLSPCTYGMASPAPGALITTLRPGPPSITACENSGEFTDSNGVPATCGYTPSDAHTYHDDIAPRSSLPGSPPGVGVYSSDWMRRTVACVSHGAPALLYTQGVANVGSLPCQ